MINYKSLFTTVLLNAKFWTDIIDEFSVTGQKVDRYYCVCSKNVFVDLHNKNGFKYIIVDPVRILIDRCLFNIPGWSLQCQHLVTIRCTAVI